MAAELHLLLKEKGHETALESGLMPMAPGVPPHAAASFAYQAITYLPTWGLHPEGTPHVLPYMYSAG